MVAHADDGAQMHPSDLKDAAFSQSADTKSSNTKADQSAKTDKSGKSAEDQKSSKDKAAPDTPKKGSEHGKAHRFDWHNVIEFLAFLIGLAIFLYPLIASYVNYSRQTAAIDDYDRIVAQLTPAQREKMWRDAKAYDIELSKPHLRDPFSTKSLRAPLDRYWKTLDVDGHGMMAYVEIPKIHVKLPVYHGTSDAVLAKGTGHIATTHLPTDNKTIHSVITGHTGLVGHIFFDNLTQMKIGDTFEVRVLTHHLTYRVDSITVIWPTQVQALQPVAGHNYVTLLTCTPYGVNDHRLLVRGKFIGESKPLTQPSGLPLWVLWLFLIMVLICVCLESWCRRRRTHNRELLEDDQKKGAADDDKANSSASSGSDPAKVADAAVAATTTAAAQKALADQASQAGSSGHDDSHESNGSDESHDPNELTQSDGDEHRLDEKKIRRHIRWQTFGIWVFSILAVFFAWASFGMMMRTGFLPAFDLGYSWWDSHVTYWFSITGMQHLSMPINW